MRCIMAISFFDIELKCQMQHVVWFQHVNMRRWPHILRLGLVDIPVSYFRKLSFSAEKDKVL